MKAIFWDLDGVLINSMNTHAISWQKALKEHKLTVTKKQLMEMGGLSYKDTIIEIAKQNKKNLTKEEINIIFERKKEIMNKLKSKVKPYNIKSELKQLNNKNIKQYIVTGSIKKYAQEEIKKHFPNIFEDIISANDVKNSKPHPDPYLKALKETKLKNKDCIIIEDSPLGVESANSAKITAYAIETSVSKEHLKKADKIFKNHKELFETLLK